MDNETKNKAELGRIAYELWERCMRLEELSGDIPETPPYARTGFTHADGRTYTITIERHYNN